MSIEEKLNRLCVAIESLAQLVAAGAINPSGGVKEPEAAVVTRDFAEGKKVPAVDKKAPAEEKKASAMTIEQVRAALTPIIQEHTPAIVAGVIQSMGHEKLSDLPVSSYPELLTKVNEAVAAKAV